MLSGDGTGENLHGLITQATAFSTALLSAASGWNKIDIVGRPSSRSPLQRNSPDVHHHAPERLVWHPLTKDSFGRYILGDPQTSVNAKLFDLTVIPTTSIAAEPSSSAAATQRRRDSGPHGDSVRSVRPSIRTTSSRIWSRCRAEKRMCAHRQTPGELHHRDIQHFSRRRQLKQSVRNLAAMQVPRASP